MYKDEAGTWRCSSCDYCSKSSTSVSEHIESKHIQGPGFACDICQHVCPTRKALKMHIFRGKHYWWEEKIEIHNISHILFNLCRLGSDDQGQHAEVGRRSMAVSFLWICISSGRPRQTPYWSKTCQQWWCSVLLLYHCLSNTKTTFHAYLEEA